MYLNHNVRPRVVRLGDGTVLSLADLPDRGTIRWTARRKADVVNAIEHGLLRMREAQARYDLSDEEIASWMSTFRKEGASGLKQKAMLNKRPFCMK